MPVAVHAHRDKSEVIGFKPKKKYHFVPFLTSSVSPSKQINFCETLNLLLMPLGGRVVHLSSFI